MKKLFTNGILPLCISVLFLLTANEIFAQSAGTTQANTPPPPPSAPIDGGVMLLLAAGLAYGAKKLYNK